MGIMVSSPCRPFFRLVRRVYLVVFALFLLGPSASLAGLTDPLAVSNQSPLIQIYGLPGMNRSSLLPVGEVEIQFAVDVANHFIQESADRESLQLDGESYRCALRLSYGFSDRLEFGLEIPYLAYRGGHLDSFIDDWHNFFGLPTNGRENAPRNQLDFLYQRDGVERLRLNEDTEGIGDVRLRAAWQLSKKAGSEPTAVALHGSLKLPTGDSDNLTGSGSTDFALWLSAGRQKSFAWGDLALMASLGGLVMGNGEVLEDQQRRFVWFGGVGLAVQPWQRVKLQVQTDFHSSFYDRSQLREVDSFSGQLAMGGTIILNDRHELELAVVEDIIVGTAPDVVFHLAWAGRF